MVCFWFFVFGVIINLFIVFSGKQSIFAAIIHTIYLWLIAVFSYDVVDYENYYLNYQSNGMSPISISPEIGYLLISKAFWNAGASFQLFRGFIITLSFLLLIASIIKIKTSYNLVVACFSLYPFFMIAIQLRTFLAIAILTFGVVYFLFSNKKVLFAITVIVASIIHSSFIVFLLFLLYDVRLEKKGIRNLIIIIAVLSSIFFKLGNAGVPIINSITKFFNSDDRFAYWLTSRTRYGFLYYWLLILIEIAIASIISNKATVRSDLAQFLQRLSILMVITFPLYTLASTMGRLISDVSVISYLGWNPKDFRNSDKKISIHSIPAHYFYLVFLSLSYLIIWNNLELLPEINSRVFPFFLNNYFFEIMR